MITTFSNNNYHTLKQNKKNNNAINFGLTPQEAKNVIKDVNGILKPVAYLVSQKENKGGLSNLRFIQDTATNWVPKALFARSIADFGEVSFLEFLESGLFYYAPNVLGEKISRKGIFSKFLPKAQREHLATPLIDLKRNETLDNKDLKNITPIKAALVLSCAVIPAAEYALSYAKNLFTLKVFKKADFNNVANLQKDQKEDPKQQEKVKNSSIKHLKSAGLFSLGALGASIALAVIGPKSKTLQKCSEAFLHPGASLYSKLQKQGIQKPKLQKFLETYFNLDFDKNAKGGLILSNGQLAVSVISGVVGYFGAAKDRGKLDVLEVATRVPLVAAYTIFGSDLLDSSFKNILYKKGKFSNLLYKDTKGELQIKRLEELKQLAETAAQKSGKTYKQELNKLFKQKTVLNLAPFTFTLVGMGFALSAINRFWTQYRFNKGIGRNHTDSISNSTLYENKMVKQSSTFNAFLRPDDKE